ncbi:MAG: cyclic pyranopterin phosphate synthase MoaA, partial [Floccifex sp.]
EDMSYQDILDLLIFADQHQITLRFIELMPMKKDSKTGQFNKQYVFNLARENKINLIPTKKKLGNGPAHYYQMNKTYIGFIEPIHGKFCHECNRVRLTSLGFLKACLFHEIGYDLKRVIQNQGNLEQVMKEVIYNKPASHQFEERAAGVAMNEIGG